MKFCTNCGMQLEDDTLFCTNCGMKQEELRTDSKTKPESKNVERKMPNSSAQANTQSDMTVKIRKIRRDIMECTNSQELFIMMDKFPEINQYQELSTTYTQKLNNLLDKEQESSKRIRRSNQGTVNLWTWIRAAGGKTIYENNENDNLTKESFMVSVADKLKENEIPAQIISKNIIWDGGKQTTAEYAVDIKDPTLENPYEMLLQFVRIGKFTFVGNNLFITPPHLPKFPREEVKVPSGGAWIACLLGFLMTFFELDKINTDTTTYYGMSASSTSTGDLTILLAGIALLIIGGLFIFDRRQKIENNRLRKQEIAAWNLAWDEWEESHMEYVFQQVVNGRLECIREAIVKSVKQVCDEKFSKAPVVEEKAETKQSDIEAIIAKKRSLVQ